VRFQTDSVQVEKLVTSRLETYVNALIHARAFVASAPKVNGELFRQYVQEVSIIQKYPGTLGIGYILPVKPEEVGAHELRVRREGFPKYRVWPLSSGPRGQGFRYFPITYYEPRNEGNLRLMGFDVASEPSRRATQDSAVRSGLPMITEKIALVRDAHKGKVAGFVMYAAIYDPRLPAANPEERKKAAAGFIQSVFRASTFFEALLEQNPIHSAITFDVFDGTETRKDALLFSLNPDQKTLPNFGLTRKTEVGGRAWTIAFRALPGFVSSWSRWAPSFVFFMGLFVSSLFAFMIWSAQTRAENEHKLAGEIQQALAARDEFISIASHELKTPITSLKLQVDLAKRVAQQDPNRAFQLITKSGSRQVDRLLDLVNELLDVTRIQTGKMNFSFELVDLAELTRELVERYQDSLSQGGYELTLHAPGPVVAEMDRFRIEQVVTNLLGNAIKYGEQKPIHLSVEKTESCAVISVSDQGVGIPEEKQELIFQRFERVEHSGNVGGLGLGLYISKKIVDMHHGRIEVRSRPDAGSTFRVEIPLRQVRSAAS
jgi:two-component system, OmpR family, sensor kinase